MRIMLFILIFLFCSIPAWADVNDLERVVCDPVQDLIYPQQLIVGIDGSFYILDTVSNSSHIKVYSRAGKFINGLIPAGAGEKAVQFDLGLTLLSGKNIFSVGDDGRIVVLDNEDNWSVLKVFDSDGKPVDTKSTGYRNEDYGYGAVCVDDDRIYIEHNDIILTGDYPLSEKLTRFSGKRGEAISNWDIANKRLIMQVDNEIVVFNQNALPVDSIDIAEILNNPVTLDIFDIAVSSQREVAITGEVFLEDETSTPFLAVIPYVKKDKKYIQCEKYITSLDYDQMGNLFGLVADMESASIIKYDTELNPVASISIDLHRPVLSHPRQVAVADDGSIWLDDQYNPDDLVNPYTTEGDMILVLKHFVDFKMREYEMDKLGLNRFASVFLDFVEKYICLSGVIVDSNVQAVSTPVFMKNVKAKNGEIICLHDADNVFISKLKDENEKERIITLNPDTGALSISELRGASSIAEETTSSPNLFDEGIPIICQIDDKLSLMQAANASEFGLPSIMHLEIESDEVSHKWKTCDYVDLRLLYSCDDSTAVVYWFPQALMRIDEDYNILAWLDLMNEAAYDFLDGTYLAKDKSHYLLEGRYNLVYRFDDSAWENIDLCTEGEVVSAINEIRGLLSLFYARRNCYPEKLADVMEIGLIDDLGMSEILEYFLSEDVVYYVGFKYRYQFMVWGKDYDNTLFEVSDKEIIEIE